MRRAQGQTAMFVTGYRPVAGLDDHIPLVPKTLAPTGYQCHVERQIVQDKWGVEATLRIGDLGARWLALLFVAVSLTGCRPEDAHPSASKVGIAVALVLLPDRSNGCCVVVSVNDEGRSIQALCEVTAFDPDGRLVFAGLVPGPPPGGRRSPLAGGMSGLLAPPGRHVYGRVDLPVDLTRDTYRSKCRVAIWHGAPPL